MEPEAVTPEDELEQKIEKLMEDNKHLHLDVQAQIQSANYWKQKFTELMEKYEK